MPRFAANLSSLFTELTFLDRFAAASQSRFNAVEYLFPYDYPKEQLAELLHRHHLKQVVHNLPSGNWEAGERGIACHPDRVPEFSAGVAKAIEYATALGVPRVNCLAGKAPVGVDGALLRRTLVENLRYAAGELKKAGLKLLMEPINTFDIPGFYVNRS